MNKEGPLATYIEDIARAMRNGGTSAALDADPRIVVLGYIEENLTLIAEEESVLLMEKESMRLWPNSWGDVDRQRHAEKQRKILALLEQLTILLDYVFPGGCADGIRPS